MALKEQDIVFTGKDTSGNTVIQMPITRIENVEGAIRTVNDQKPDENGNVRVDSGGVKSVNMVGPDDLGNVAVDFPVTSVQGATGDVELIFVSGGDSISVSKSWKATTTYTYTVTSSGVANMSATAGIGIDITYSASGDDDPVASRRKYGNSTLVVSYNGTTIFNKTTSGASTYWSRTNATVVAGDTITVKCSRSYNASGSSGTYQDYYPHSFSFTMDPMLIVPKEGS